MWTMVHLMDQLYKYYKSNRGNCLLVNSGFHRDIDGILARYHINPLGREPD